MPDIRKPDLNLVLVLDALLTERNLTRAGERLGITQPAVSAALARLRDLYGDPLLERKGRDFTLTARAEALMPTVAECMVEVHTTFEALPGFDPATSSRTFLVTASDYALAEITSPLTRLMKAEAPSTRVEFMGLPLDVVVGPIDLLRADVIIAGTGRGVPGKHASLFSDRFVCIVDRSNPAVEDGHLSLDALQGLRQVRSVFGPGVATHVDDMLNAHGLVQSVATTVQGFLAVPFAVMGTPWVGWVPERTATRLASALNLQIVETDIVPSVLVEAAHWHPSKTNDPALRWLVGRLRAAAELVEFGEAEQDDPTADDAV